MVDDLLNLLNVKDDEYLTGTYYERRPKDISDSGMRFTYDNATAREISYMNLLNNIQVGQEISTIRTTDLPSLRKNNNNFGYVKLQDSDNLWQITSYEHKPARDENKEALRWVKETAGKTYLLRLLAVENEWGLQ